MENQKESNGWRTFSEHGCFILSGLVLAIALFVRAELMYANEAIWIRLATGAFVLMFCGGGLICYAKVPAYRAGEFVTFGIRSVPQSRRGFYRAGWTLFLFGVVLNLILLISSP